MLLTTRLIFILYFWICCI